MLKISNHLIQSFLLFLFACLTNGNNLIVKLNIEDRKSNIDPLKIKYYWASGQSDNRILNVKLNLQIENLNDKNIVLNQAASITVICSTKADPDNLFARLNFVNTLVNDLTSTKSVQVPFTIGSNGQPPLVSCTGQVVSFTPQIALGVQLDKLNFSQSSYTKFEISSYPTISFSKKQETKLEISPFSDSKFDVYFRDTTLYDTEVSCLLSGTGPLPISLSSPNKIRVNSGVNSVEVRYTVSVTSVQQLSTSITLSCSAESIGIAGADKQYQTSFASESIAVGLKKPKIEASTNLLTITGTRFRLPLKLNPTKKSLSDITVECDLRRFKTFTELQTFQSTVSSTTCADSLPNVVEPSLAEFTYNNQNFDFYFIDSVNSSMFTKRKEYTFDSTDKLNFLEIGQKPVTPLKSNFNLFMSLLCCDKSTTGIKYETFASKISLILPKNSDASGTYQNTTTNVELLDPKYSPCTCDLTLNSCDLNCCCDKDCNANDRTAEKLVCPTKVRGIFDKTIDRWTCNDVYNNPRTIENDWFPIICIQFNTTVLLGSYYAPINLDENTLNRNEKFNSKIQEKLKESYGFRSRYVNDPLFPTNGLAYTTSSLCTLDPTTYKYGSCLQQAESESDEQASDYFRFPQSSKSFPSCLYDAPIKFISSNERTFCPVKIDLKCIETNSVLNYENYINKIIISKNEKIKLDNIEYYYCPQFLASQIPQAQLPSNDCPNTCNCKFDPKTKLFDNIFTCQDSWFEQSTKVPFDNIENDFYLKPNSQCRKISSGTNPSISGGKCNNILAGLKHVIFWKGSSILKILTRVILTDQLELTNNFKQMFEIKWVNLPNLDEDLFNLNGLSSVSEFDDLQKNPEYIKTLRSGKKGYAFGKPIISGLLKNNMVDISYKNRLSTYKTLNGKLCGLNNQQERVLVNFGQNVSSTCIVKITYDDLITEDKCKTIRKIMFEKLNDYFVPSTLISKNGNPDLTINNQTDWTKIFPETRLLNFTDAGVEFDRCKQVPYKINLFIFYDEVGKQNGEIINEIFGAYVTYSYKDWVYVCKSSECLSPTYAQEFSVEFEANFINSHKKNLTWFDKCRTEKYPSEICIEEALWTWPRDPTDQDFYYLYTVHLSLIFGILCTIVVHYMLFGFMCPC